MKAKAIITDRLLRLEGGDFGDHKRFDNIGELRIHYGPGYRVYFTERISDEDEKVEIIVLLVAGDKDSQKRDIKKAKEMAEELQ